MKSRREIIREYNSMLATEELQGEVDPNRVNCYTCPDCGGITKTIDRDKGVIPFMFVCKKADGVPKRFGCNGLATSSFYKDIAPSQEPTYEWYRPTLEETIKMRKNDAMLEHTLQGGLSFRKIKNDKHG